MQDFGRHPFLCRTYPTTDAIIDAFMNLGRQDKVEVMQDLVSMNYHKVLGEHAERGLLNWLNEQEI